MSDWNDSSRNHNGISIPWWVILVAFCVFPPAGVLLFIYALNQKSQPSRRQQEWQRKQKEWFDSVNQAEADAAEKSAEKQPTPNYKPKAAQPASTGRKHTGRTNRKKIRDGKMLTVVGMICAALFGFIAIDEFLFYMPSFSWYALEEIFVPLFFSCASVGVAAWGWLKTRQARRFRKLLNLIGNQKLVDIHAVAEAFPCKYDKACEMLQDMAYMGYLGQKAYVDSASGQLVLTGEGVRARRKAEQKAADEAKKAQGKEEEELSILREIRAVNDAIPDPVLSRKISRIEEITGHILEYQTKHPEKAGELHTFLNYYLPTTLKILNAYAELESQGVEGENISATKDRIERMMDMVVEGFENQLDKLFRDDMLDITSDISVMEKMMGRDGLAGDMQMPKVEEDEASEPSQPEGIHLTLDPEGDGAEPQKSASWESGFYRKTKEELNES